MDDELEKAKEKQPKRTSREETRLAVAVVLTGLVSAFAVLNLGKTKVNYVFGTGHPRLLFIVVACLAIGVAIGWMAARRRAKD
ncbi:MAG: hypothetical protein E6G41_01920 [Actinobacteria bacterium]|nr:MAG: hypothetical protein E6G41_01920 [Actinomycetota bacterium]